ncbi:hypothetical protein GJ496_005505 [Pomphorhynchus laevis]|nr:hypothetical protein GJ496_005505 [Pomphorhynchus laevis]
MTYRSEYTLILVLLSIIFQTQAYPFVVPDIDEFPSDPEYENWYASITPWIYNELEFPKTVWYPNIPYFENGLSRLTRIHDFKRSSDAIAARNSMEKRIHDFRKKRFICNGFRGCV